MILHEFLRDFQKASYTFLIFLIPKQIAELIQELEKEHQLRVLNKLGIEQSGQVMDLMENDDLASLLENLSPDKIEKLLSGMKREESKIVQNIMNYPSKRPGE